MPRIEPVTTRSAVIASRDVPATRVEVTTEPTDHDPARAMEDAGMHVNERDAGIERIVPPVGSVPDPQRPPYRFLVCDRGLLVDALEGRAGCDRTCRRVDLPQHVEPRQGTRVAHPLG